MILIIPSLIMSKKMSLHFREWNIGFQLGCSVDSRSDGNSPQILPLSST